MKQVKGGGVENGHSGRPAYGGAPVQTEAEPQPEAADSENRREQGCRAQQEVGSRARTRVS